MKLGIYKYDDEKILAVTNVVSVVASSLLPTLSIFVLYFLQDPRAKLGVIVAMTSLFSVSMAILAKARRVEAFAAATA